MLLALPNARVIVLLIGLPIIAIVTLIAAAISSYITATSMKDRRYLTAVSALVLPVICAVVAMNFAITLRTCATASIYVQFYLGYPFFARTVSQLPRGNGPRLAVFTMDGFISMSNGVAFDESDELSLPVGQQTSAWKIHAAHTELGDGDWVAKEGHRPLLPLVVRGLIYLHWIAPP